MGNLTLQGATSGQITLAPTAVAGTNTITLPAATGTLLTTAGGQTISGTVTLSTLTSPAATSLTIQSAGTTAMTINTSQNVGIGTTSTLANSLLNVSQGVVARNSGAINGYFQLYNDTAGTDLKTWRMGNLSTGALRFETVNDAYTSATARMLIDSSGNVGIGTSSPSTKLHVVGEVTATQGVGGYPAFHATTAGTQTFTTNTATKVTFSVEEFDTNNNFASSRFTPTVEGYYQINGVFWFIAGTAATDANAMIYKNGALYSQARAANYGTTQASCPISDIVYCNGTTDFIEFYGRATGTGTLTASTNIFFSGCLIRGA